MKVQNITGAILILCGTAVLWLSTKFGFGTFAAYIGQAFGRSMIIILILLLFLAVTPLRKKSTKSGSQKSNTPMQYNALQGQYPLQQSTNLVQPRSYQSQYQEQLRHQQQMLAQQKWLYQQRYLARMRQLNSKINSEGNQGQISGLNSKQSQERNFSQNQQSSSQNNTFSPRK